LSRQDPRVGISLSEQLTVSADIDQSSHVGTDTAPVLLLQDVGFVPGELFNNAGVGHGVAFEEHEHALVVLDWLADALSVDDCVGVVDVGGVEVRILFVVGSEPVGDVLVSFEAPEVLVGLEDLLNGVGVRHDAFWHGVDDLWWKLRSLWFRGVESQGRGGLIVEVACCVNEKAREQDFRVNCPSLLPDGSHFTQCGNKKSQLHSFSI
jgi:hypothetical protein